MRAILEIDSGSYRSLITHLFPASTCVTEQAAFLLTKERRSGSSISFEVVESQLLGPKDIAVQRGDYIQMTDFARASLIKRGHDLNVSLVEVHSHLGPWPAGFSLSDLVGLRETVPNLWWRLDHKPYLALVCTRRDFDALVWIDNPRVPQALDAWRIGDHVRSPTNISIEGW